MTQAQVQAAEALKDLELDRAARQLELELDQPSAVGRTARPRRRRPRSPSGTQPKPPEEKRERTQQEAAPLTPCTQLTHEDLLFFNLIFDILVAPGLDQHRANPLELATAAAVGAATENSTFSSRIRMAYIKHALLRNFLSIAASTQPAANETQLDHLHSCFIRSALAAGIVLL